MGLRRFFRNLRRDALLRGPSIEYEGLAIPTRRSGMNRDILNHLYARMYERPEIAGLTRVVRPGDRVLELGAGLGIISALAARAAGPQGRVRSYEANSALLDDTRAFLTGNGMTTVDLVHAVLVSEPNPAPRRFHLAESFAEGSLLPKQGHDNARTVEVPAQSLACVLAEFRPDVLICDIEGAEAELLPALPPSTLRAAVVELHPDRLTPDQIQSIHDAMAAFGLLPQEPGPGGTVVIYAQAGGK